MLVLSRKPNQTIRIGDEMSITVLSIERGAVKLGIEAPNAVAVHRAEVYERIQAENRRAARRLSAARPSVASVWPTRKKNTNANGT